VNTGLALIAGACALILTGQRDVMIAGGIVAAIAILFFGEVRS